MPSAASRHGKYILNTAPAAIQRKKPEALQFLRDIMGIYAAPV